MSLGRNRFRLAGFLAIATGLALGLVTVAARAHYAQRSGIYQLVRKNPDADLFGDSAFEKVGEPQVYVIEDPAVVIPGVQEGGHKTIDATKPRVGYFQLKTVDFYANAAGLGAVALAGVGVLGVLFARNSSKS